MVTFAAQLSALILFSLQTAFAGDVFVTIQKLGASGYPTSSFKYGGASAQLLEVNTKGLTLSVLTCSSKF
jgi:hypothetical protein